MSISVVPHEERVHAFLAQQRIAISGLSRSKDSGAGAIYLLLREKGYDVFPLHPEAKALHGDPCYQTLYDIPGGVDAVFIMNSPDVTEHIVDDAIELGVQHIWMHNNTIMPNSVSKEAVERAHAAGLSVIDVGCPMMFLEDTDGFHKGMCWFLRVTGQLK